MDGSLRHYGGESGSHRRRRAGLAEDSGRFYEPFAVKLKQAGKNQVEIKPEEAGKDCPECQRPMVIRMGRFGKFLACSGFPECRYTESFGKNWGKMPGVCKDIITTYQKGRRFMAVRLSECNFAPGICLLIRSAPCAETYWSKRRSR